MRAIDNAAILARRREALRVAVGRDGAALIPTRRASVEALRRMARDAELNLTRSNTKAGLILAIRDALTAKGIR